MSYLAVTTDASTFPILVAEADVGRIHSPIGSRFIRTIADAAKLVFDSIENTSQQGESIIVIFRRRFRTQTGEKIFRRADFEALLAIKNPSYREFA